MERQTDHSAARSQRPAAGRAQRPQPAAWRPWRPAGPRSRCRSAAAVLAFPRDPSLPPHAPPSTFWTGLAPLPRRHMQGGCGLSRKPRLSRLRGIEGVVRVETGGRQEGGRRERLCQLSIDEMTDLDQNVQTFLENLPNISVQYQ